MLKDNLIYINKIRELLDKLNRYEITPEQYQRELDKLLEEKKDDPHHT